MILRYESFVCNDINSEIEKIKLADEVELRVSTTDKGLLFLLGILFALGKKIKIINESELDLEEKGKSFYKMAYVFEKLGDDKFPNDDYSNVNTDFDVLINNVKTLGVKNYSFDSVILTESIFLICPVRNATEDQISEYMGHVKKMNDEGLFVHAPHIHTFQKDILGGYSICFQNSSAIASSKEIHIYYDQSSKGTMFDLGVAYTLNKPLRIVNEEEIEFASTDFGDVVLKKWSSEGQRLIKN